MLESFLEPVKTDKDESCVDKYRGREHRNEVEDDLLVGVKQIEVNCIQATLGGRTGREEKRIDVLQVIAGVDDNGGYQSHRDNVDIMDTDEVQMQVLYEWYSGLVAPQLAKDCGKHPGRGTVAPPWYRVSQLRKCATSSPRAGAGKQVIYVCIFGGFRGRGIETFCRESRNGDQRATRDVPISPAEVEDSRMRQKACVSLWL